MSSTNHQQIRNNLQRVLAMDPSTRLISLLYRSVLSAKVFECFTRQIGSYLTFPDIMSLTQVCKASRDERGPILENLLTDSLKPFLHDPNSFRKLMDKTRSIISGSFVVWLLLRDPDWNPEDLDIYVPFGQTKKILSYLSDLGYETASIQEEEDQLLQRDDIDQGNGSSRWDRYPTRRIKPGLKRVTKLRKGGCRIDVLEGYPDAITPIFDFHSTAVMNYISSDTIEALYPNHLFNNYSITRNHVIRDGDHRKWKKKYEARSFRVVPLNELPVKYLRGSCPEINRKLYDRYSLTVKIPLYSQAQRPLLLQSTRPLSTNKWNLLPKSTSHSNCTGSYCLLEDYRQASPSKKVLELIAAEANTSFMEIACAFPPHPRCTGLLLLMERERERLSHRILTRAENPHVMVKHVETAKYLDFLPPSLRRVRRSVSPD